MGWLYLEVAASPARSAVSAKAGRSLSRPDGDAALAEARGRLQKLCMASRPPFFEPLRQERRLLPLLVMICFIMSGSGIVSPILSIYAQTFGVAATLVGTLVTMFGVGRLVANFPAGILSQRVGRRPLLIVGPLIVAAASLGAALATGFVWLVVWRFFQGLGSGIYITASMAAMADISPPGRRAGNMALYQTALQIGATIGPGIGGYVAQWFGYAAPFWVYMCVGLVAAATAIFSFDDTLNVAEARKPLPSSVRRVGMMTEAFTVVCVLTLAIFFTRVVTLFQLIPLLGAETFGLDVGTIGLALTVCAFTNLFGLPVTTPLIEKFGARAVVIGTSLATAISMAMLWFDSSVIWFWSSVAIMGVAMGISYPAISSYVIGCLPRERYGPGMGMQRTFGDVGFVFGPVIAGALDDVAGPGHTAVIVLNVGFLVACTLLFAVGSRGKLAFGD